MKEFEHYKYPELVEMAKEYGIKAQNMPRPQLEAALKSHMDAEGAKDFSGSENTDLEANPKRTKRKVDGSTENTEPGTRTFETKSKVEFRVNGEKFEGTRFTFSTEIFAARKQLVENAYGKEIFV